MGKRKHDENYYKEKIRKLKKKLRKVSSPSSSPARSLSERYGSSSSLTASANVLVTPSQVASEHGTTFLPTQKLSPAPVTLSGLDAMDCGPSTSTANMDQTPINAEEETIPSQYLLALGEEGAEKEELGDPLQPELALRWARILQNGLGKEAKDAIIKKYPTPSNFSQSIAPKLNPEIKMIMSELSLKRDSRISYRQKLTGNLINCLGKSLTKILKGTINTKELVEEISDGAKIASQIFYEDSSSRKFFALGGANKNIREGVKNCKSDDFLFGSDCAEKIKSAQALKKTGDIIKNNDTQPTNRKQKPTTKKQGNWKGPLHQQQQHRVRSGPPQQQYQPQAQQPQFRTHRREWKRPAKTRARPRY